MTMLRRMQYYSLIIGLMTLLAACQGQPSDDLDAFFARAEHTPVTPLTPLPQVAAFYPARFDADHTLNDPFVPRKATVKSVLEPDLKRPKQPLENYPLESLKFVGILSKHKKVFAMIQTPDNQVVQVQAGQYLGDHLGKIVALGENPRSGQFEMTIRETLQDADSGEWVVQTKTMQLQDTP